MHGQQHIKTVNIVYFISLYVQFHQITKQNFLRFNGRAWAKSASHGSPLIALTRRATQAIKRERRGRKRLMRKVAQVAVRTWLSPVSARRLEEKRGHVQAVGAIK